MPIGTIFVCLANMLRKILIKPGRDSGYCEIIIFEKKKLFLVEWWKEVSIKQYPEEEAYRIFNDFIKQYDLPSSNIYDWMADKHD